LQLTFTDVVLLHVIMLYCSIMDMLRQLHDENKKLGEKLEEMI
jgi:hypothetical protein